MKIKKDYILREVAHQYVVVPIGEAALNFNGVISLSSSGALLWKLLQNDSEIDDLVRLMINTYQVTEDVARNDVSAFIKKMQDNGLIE